MTKTVYYKKVGRRYVPVSEYDSELLDSFPKGSHLVTVYPGGSSRRFNIDPAWAPMIAAGHFAEDAITAAIFKADEIQPPRKAMTEEERDAWQNLIDVWGDEARSLRRPAIRDVSEAAVKAMQQQADQLLQKESVRRAYEHFMLVCKLAMEKDHE